MSNILFIHNTVNNNAPATIRKYFYLKEMNHQHSPINNLNNVYRLPKGSLQLPIYKTNSGKTSIRYTCSIAWKQILKELSIANIDKYDRDPYWINNTRVNSLMLKKHFLESFWAHKDLQRIHNNLIAKNINGRQLWFFLFLIYFNFINDK